MNEFALYALPLLLGMAIGSIPFLVDFVEDYKRKKARHELEGD